MKTFRPEEYVVASSLEQVSTLLKEHRERARIIAGGTTIHELSFRGLMGNVKILIDISNLDLSYVKLEKDNVLIGATTTFGDLLQTVESRWPIEFAALAETVRSIRPVQVRNVATVGGSICTSLPFFDLPPTLLALGSRVKVTGASGERVIPIENFFLDFFLTDVRPGEMVTEIQVPFPSGNTSGAFRKLESNSVDWALVSAAVQLRKTGNQIGGARVALGGAVGRKVVRAGTVEKALEGKEPTEENVRKAAEAVTRDVKPLSDFRASSEYRTEALKVLTRRCVQTALSRIK